MFNYKYVPEDEMKPEARILQEGEGTFKINGAYDTDKNGLPLKTREGNNKVNIVLIVKDSIGQSGLIYDNISETSSYRIKSLVESIGLPGLYNPQGNLDLRELQGRGGKCIIKTDKSENPRFQSKSVIAKYISKGSIASDYTEHDYDDSDIPF